MSASSVFCQGTVASIDWARFLPLYQQAGRRSFLAELEREVPDLGADTYAGWEDPGWSSSSPRAPVQRRKKLVAALSAPGSG